MQYYARSLLLVTVHTPVREIFFVCILATRSDSIQFYTYDSYTSQYYLLSIMHNMHTLVLLQLEQSMHMMHKYQRVQYPYYSGIHTSGGKKRCFVTLAGGYPPVTPAGVPLRKFTQYVHTTCMHTLEQSTKQYIMYARTLASMLCVCIMI